MHVHAIIVVNVDPAGVLHVVNADYTSGIGIAMCGVVNSAAT